MTGARARDGGLRRCGSPPLLLPLRRALRARERAARCVRAPAGAHAVRGRADEAGIARPASGARCAVVSRAMKCVRAVVMRKGTCAFAGCRRLRAHRRAAMIRGCAFGAAGTKVASSPKNEWRGMHARVRGATLVAAAARSPQRAHSVVRELREHNAAGKRDKHRAPQGSLSVLGGNRRCRLELP